MTLTTLKKLVAVVAIAGVLGTGLAMPPPVHAGTEEVLLIAAGAIAAWLVFVVIATKVIYKRDTQLPEFAPSTRPPGDAEARNGPRLGPECFQASGKILSVCW